MPRDSASEDRPKLPLTATPSQTVGPFFHVGLAANAQLGCLIAPGTAGDRVRLTITVLDGDDVPVNDALVEIWQADGDGNYVRPDDPAQTMTPSGFCGFGRLGTDETGTCVFETIRPGRVRNADGTVEASHINVCLFARGLLRQLFTRVYFAGDDSLDADPILSLVPPGRRATLLARQTGEREWAFVVHLQGDLETVFFDL
jgi:protocatechuate 3,4-dioxygenase alpha subunit